MGVRRSHMVVGRVRSHHMVGDMVRGRWRRDMVMCVERSSMVYWHWSRHSMNGRGLRERTGVWRSGSRGVLIQRRSGGRGHRRSNILIQSLQGRRQLPRGQGFRLIT
jgi:hypothetical protein